MRRSVLVTGATSGIGKSCAELFAKNGFNVIITGRRGDRLQTFKEQLVSLYNVDVTLLEFDVRNRMEVNAALERSGISAIDILVNNAGLALGRENIETGDIADWDTMLQTNVQGLLYVTRAVLPLMKSSSSPHIINIGSIAGKEVYENGAVYCASKFAVKALTEGMRIDLVKCGIKVTAVNPGAVETEFSLVRFKGDKEKALAVYEKFTPLTPEDVAGVVFYCATLPQNVCINEVTVMPTDQASSTVLRTGLK